MGSNCSFNFLLDFNEEEEFLLEAQIVNEGDKEEESRQKHVELGVFFDTKAYATFSQLYDDDEIMESILAYFNQLIAIYAIPSLGTRKTLSQFRSLKIQIRRKTFPIIN